MILMIVSDSSYARTLSVSDGITDPCEIAYKYGRGERGEIVYIWYSQGEPDTLPDAAAGWDTRRRKYRPTAY